jgi:hypothetical protein
MSALVQLLAVGRSLVTPQSVGRPVRSKTSGYLPTFRLVQRVKGQSSGGRGLRLPIRFFGSRPPERVEVTPPAPAEHRQATPPPNRPPETPAPAQLRSVSADGSESANRPQERVLFAFRVPARRPAQGVPNDLKLDQVRVVRNDLSEADLEVTPRKPEPKAEAATPKPQEQETIGYTLKDWARLAGRLSVFARSRT